MIMAGSAMAKTCDAVIEKGRLVASHLLEAAKGDIEFAAGAFRVTGTDRQIKLLEVAARLKDWPARPADVPASPDSAKDYSAPD